ncbi:J domain-containing protein required for chloroplast accumulation response 1 [Neltuma alba]|uniref:J domain-containing protein required for chloroplast accumulation response 1 n=1 Tax=Neltuma alba TaxID=207710 RepID=UPI0010A41A73|nr:J domain-containing protein required for chloroplast accumulation response 1-like [Prosopis alba]
MERFSQSESILLGYNHQRPSTNPSTPLRNSDVDFHDVFGGPPRRSSIQEMRYGIGESPDFSASRMEEDGVCCAWPCVGEKPVFGEDNLNRRRHTNDNFYDDIFGGDESPCRTPVKHERHPFSSTPASRILSPAPPLPPAPASPAPPPLPPTLSLPAKLTKGTDLPTFGSPTRSLRTSAALNGLSSSDSPATHLSRFSSHATQGKEELNNGSGTLRPSRSSHEISDLSVSDKADKGGDSAGQFHFSIYKWASKGAVPLLMPLRTERNSRTKENVKLERCTSAKDWIARESTSQSDGSLANTSSSSLKSRQHCSATFVTSQNVTDSLDERGSAKPNLTSLSTLQNVTKDVSGSSLSSDAKAESSINSVSEKEVSGKMKEELVQTIKTHKAESKSSHSLFSKSDGTQDYLEKIKMEKGKESKTMKPSALCDISTNWKKQVKKTVDLKDVEAAKAALQSSLRLDENMENVKVKGKVKEFVRIFNQEAFTKPRVGTKSYEYKLRSVLRRTEEAEDSPQLSKKEDSATETTNIFGNDLSRQDDISATDNAIPDSTVTVEDGLFHGNFLVKELAQDENEVLQTQDNEEIKVIDDKIRQWSNGKQGNIRSLLSTLQYVLWPDSGWRPVPLVDIIEGNAVKRAYQRALLCLHPDKLQQKGAASHQKYIAEKVFDILQEAWTHFNMLGAV